MFEAVRAWVKRHRVWSAIIALILLLVLYRALRPTPHDYEYVSETVTRGEVLRKVSATDFDTEWATPSGGGGSSLANVFAVSSLRV